MFQIPKQRGVLILVAIFIANNLIVKCKGQVTSCYEGQTSPNDIGDTRTNNCSYSGNLAGTGCSISDSYSSNQPSLSYKCSSSNDCEQAKNKCCYINNCNKPPTEAIPPTTVNSCYFGETLNGFGYLRPLTNSDLSNTLGEYRACVVK
jgi:hypothetical protein